MRNKIIITQESLEPLARAIHGDKYSYERSIYVNNKTKIEIFCNTCKKYIFISPYEHICKSTGCWSCSYQLRGAPRRKTIKDIEEESIRIYGDVFDFSQAIYKNATTKMTIIHKPCGKSFTRSANQHISNKRSCPHCSKTKKLTPDILLDRLSKLYENKFIFPDLNYKNRRTKIKIMCLECGHIFYRTPMSLFNQANYCPKCLDKVTDTESFIKTAQQLYGDKFDYSKSLYVNCNIPILIKCNECGQWFSKKSNNHLNRGTCPYHKMSKGERNIKLFLDTFDINYKQQERFVECKNIIQLPFDFSLKDINGNLISLIEFQGAQHFKPVNFGGIGDDVALENFEQVKFRDKIKKKYCVDNNIPLLEITYKDIKQVDLIIIKHLKSIGISFNY